MAQQAEAGARAMEQQAATMNAIMESHSAQLQMLLQREAFAVTASLDQTFTAPVQLLDGVPIVGFVNQSHYQYYTAHVVAPPNSRVLITITPVFGDPDLYVTTDGSQPGKSNWNFRSVSWGGVAQDSVSIEAGKPHYCNDCMVRIAVYGFMQSQYTIAYTTESTIARLVDGEQQQGYVLCSGQWL